MSIFLFTSIRRSYSHMLNFFNSFTIKTKYGTMAMTVTPVLIFVSFYIAWAYTERALKRKSNVPVLSRSMSVGALRGGKVAVERLLDYQHALADTTSLETAEAELKTLLEEEQLDFKKLQSTVAKLEMSGNEDEALRILEKALEKARSRKKEHDAYEIEMLLVELFIYKADYEKAFGCKCLDEEISDARSPLYKAIIHIMLEHPRESAVSCWEKFNEIRTHFEWPPGSQDNQLHEAVQSFDEFEKVVKQLKSNIESINNLTRG